MIHLSKTIQALAEGDWNKNTDDSMISIIDYMISHSTKAKNHVMGQKKSDVEELPTTQTIQPTVQVQSPQQTHVQANTQQTVVDPNKQLQELQNMLYTKQMEDLKKMQMMRQMAEIKKLKNMKERQENGDTNSDDENDDDNNDNDNEGESEGESDEESDVDSGEEESSEESDV